MPDFILIKTTLTAKQPGHPVYANAIPIQLHELTVGSLSPAEGLWINAQQSCCVTDCDQVQAGIPSVT